MKAFVLVTAALLIATTESCAGSQGTYLGPVGVELSQGAPAKPGKSISVGFQLTEEKGAEVTLLRAKLVGVPKGLNVMDMAAFDVTQAHGSVGALNEKDMAPLLKFLRPISGVKIEPHDMGSWAIVATVRSFTPGHYKTKGLEVTYRVGQTVFVQEFKFHVELDVVTS